MVRALDIEYKKWKQGGVDKDVNLECIKYIQECYLWPDKVKLLKSIFTNAKIDTTLQQQPKITTAIQ
jgi:hypothetical protein